MPTALIPFPSFDPVLVSIGPFAIRWYALAYIDGDRPRGIGQLSASHYPAVPCLSHSNEGLMGL